MRKLWHDDAWEDYLYWQTYDKKILKKINELIKDISRNGQDKGIGKPEPLRANLSGWWSRRITDEHRLVYFVDGDGICHISQCKGHYDE